MWSQQVLPYTTIPSYLAVSCRMAWGGRWKRDMHCYYHFLLWPLLRLFRSCAGGGGEEGPPPTDFLTLSSLSPPYSTPWQLPHLLLLQSPVGAPAVRPTVQVRARAGLTSRFVRRAAHQVHPGLATRHLTVRRCYRLGGQCEDTARPEKAFAWQHPSHRDDEAAESLRGGRTPTSLRSGRGPGKSYLQCGVAAEPLRERPGRRGPEKSANRQHPIHSDGEAAKSLRPPGPLKLGVRPSPDEPGHSAAKQPSHSEEAKPVRCTVASHTVCNARCYPPRMDW